MNYLHGVTSIFDKPLIFFSYTFIMAVQKITIIKKYEFSTLLKARKNNTCEDR